MTDLVRNGRYQIIPEGETKPRPMTRVTNFAGKASDEYSLTKWKQRNVLVGAAQRTDIVAATLAANGDKKELDRLAEAALDAAKANVGRETGTALHSLTEQVDAGMTVDMPSPIKEDLAAYSACLDSLGVTIKRMEEVVVIPDLNLAGRFDRLVEIMGKTYVMDLKTGADLSYSWLSIAIQLALYASAKTIYHPDTATHEPMPTVDQRRALVIHLPAGKGVATPYWVDLSIGRKGIRVVQDVLGWRSTKGAAEIAVNPRTEMREYVVKRVAVIVDEGYGADLAARWPGDVPTLKTFCSHTEAEFDLILEACVVVEGLCGMSFPVVEDPRVLDQPTTTKQKAEKK